MDRLDTNELSIKVLNVPMSISNLFFYCFFIICLSFWQDGAKPLKQPLKFLLVSFAALMATLQISILCGVFHKVGRYTIWGPILRFLMECCLTTVVWLGVFYYTQIVPPQSWFTIWLRKNIKRIVYIVLTLDKLLIFIDLVFDYWYRLSALNSYAHNINGTSANSNIEELSNLFVVFYVSRVLYILLSSIVMVSASVATVRYLKRHMKNMESTRSPFTTTVRSQLRVTRMCTMQGILNMLLCICFPLSHFLRHLFVHLDYYIFVTAISVHSSGTAMNFCVGQPLFRTRVVDLWIKVYKLFQLKKV